MKAKKIIGIIIMLPLILIVLGSFVASIYAAYKHIAGITYASPIIIGVAIILYLLGRFLSKDKKIKESIKNAEPI